MRKHVKCLVFESYLGVLEESIESTGFWLKSAILVKVYVHMMNYMAITNACVD